MNVAAVAAGGLGGSLAMDLVQDAFERVFVRAPDSKERDEETEAIVAVVQRIAPFVPFEQAKRHPGTVGRVLHYAFGCGFAAAYASARSRFPGIGVARGLPFGIALWFLSDAVLIPAARLGRPFWRYGAPDRANALFTHIAYGLCVEAAMALFDERE